MRRVLRYLLLPLLALVLAGSGLQAQDLGMGDLKKYKNFPVPFGPNNAGREFWTAFPANWDIPTSAQYYIRFYITSGVRTTVRIWAGPAFKKTIVTKPHDIVTVDLTPIEAQMLQRNDQAPVPPDQIYRRKAVHIQADAPIVVYGINRTTYTSDGMLLLPVNALGREYIVASYAAVIGVTQELPSQMMVIAPYNNTTVTIEQPMRTPNHAEGEKITIQMDSGDVYSAMTLGYGGDMTGAVIRASKPVAVTAGQNCTYIPNQIIYCCCDHLSEQMLPRESWGKLYQGVPFQTRKKGDFWRIFAGADNTTIYVNGQKTATLSTAGGPEGIGWFEYQAVGKGLQEFTADKPIYVAQYNPSQAWDNVPSDPFFLVLTPVEQYQTALTFCTPSGDYALNYVNFVADSATFNQIEIAAGGTDKWDYLYKYGGTGVRRTYPTLINGRRMVGCIIEIQPGVYRLRGPMPFAGYIYGFSAYDSYGYPLSVAVGDLTKPDVDAPEILKRQACDGMVDAQTLDLPEDPNIRTNLATIEVDPDETQTYNYTMTVKPFEAGVSINTTFKLVVVDPTKPARAVVIISDMAGNVTLDTFYYRPFQVTLEPKLLDFGSMNVGESRKMMVKISNLSTEPAEVKEALLRYGNRGFKLLSPTGSFILGPVGSPTASVDAEIEFTATVTGDFIDTVGLKDECGERYITLLQANVGKPNIRVTDHDFGQMVVGTAAPNWTMDVTNSGTGLLSVTGYSGPANAVFTLPNGVPLPAPTPATPWKLKAGESKQIVIAFTPAAVVKYTDALIFTHDAGPDAEDSVGVIEGEGIKSQLIATSYEWPRTRVGRMATPSKVYVKNFGNAAVRILDVTFTGDVGDFTFNKSQVVNLSVAPGDSVPVDVTFTPTMTARREMVAVYTTDPAQESTVSSMLVGFGVVPMLVTTDYDFGQMNVGDPETTRKVEFSIPTGPGFEWTDTVTITGFQFRTDQGATAVADYRRLPADQPIQLIPGQTNTVTFDGFFSAQAPGTRLAELKAITLDGVDTTSHWTGRGISLSTAITGQGGSLMNICVDDQGIINAFVENSGAIPLTVDSLVMSGGDFVIVSPDPNTPQVIAPGGRLDIQIRFNPTSSGVQNQQLFVYNSTGTPRLDLPISGSARRDVINSHVKLNASKGANIELGKDLVTELLIDPLPNGGSIFPTAKVTFTYNAAELYARVDAVQLGPICPAGSSATVNTAETVPGKLVIDVALGGPITDGGKLLTVSFGVVFSSSETRAVDAAIEIPAATCLSINPSNAQIGVEPICGLNLRLIQLAKTTYTLDQNKPNPFNPVTKIKYSLGLDGMTQMFLYDTDGKLIQKLVDEYQRPGEYELTLDVSNLPSGNYYYKLVNGTWSSTRMLTVVK